MSILVSVLMTSYNRENYIHEAIESVLASTYNNFELIIVDDCSTDKTVEIAKTYADKDYRIKVYENQVNLGDYANRNKASSYATGEYIMFVDSDDKIYPDGIERCVKAMQQFPVSGIGLFDITGANKNREPFIIESKDAIQIHFFKKPFLTVGPGGTIQRRSFFERVHRYPVKYGPANDMYHHLKAACFSPVVLLPFDFVFYRRHEGQEINNEFSYLYNNYNYLRDAVAELPLQLSEQQKEWVLKKNNRRFVVNICSYWARTFDFRRTISAIRKTSFSTKDFLNGIFHFDGKNSLDKQ